MNNKIKLITIFLLVIALTFSGYIYKYSIDKKAHRIYNQGEIFYKEGKYSDAYFNFKQIKRFSKLYEVSLLKQYKCADNLSDKKTAYIKLKEVIKISKNPHIIPWALYKEALLSEELNYTNEKNLYKKHKYIYEKFPNSDFGIASAYKIATSNENKDKLLAKKSLIDYLSYAPNGKFAKKAFEEIEKLNLELLNEENKILADAYYSNEEYKKALLYYKKASTSKYWYKISQCYKNLNQIELEKQSILYGLSKKDINIDEKEISEAINRLEIITKQDKITFLQNLFETYKTSSSYPTITYKLAEASSAVRSMKLYESIIIKYPKSIWASNSLWEIFWYNYRLSRFQVCEKLAKRHFALYSKTQDAPRIAYWYARALLKDRKISQARDILYKVIDNYPLTYYAFLSARQLKSSRAKKMILKKRITNYDIHKLDKYIFKEDEVLLYLAKNEDWQLIENFKINDNKIKAWTLYHKGNYINSINTIKKDLAENNEKITFTNQFVKMIYPILYEKEINTYTIEKNQSPYLLLSLIREESHFNKDAKSQAGALGLSQLIPSTANFIEHSTISEKKLLNPEENIRIGVNYFTYLVNYFDNNEYLAILAYNAGPGNLKKWLKNSNINNGALDVFVENIPYLETKNYIKKVLSSYWTYVNIYLPKNK